MGELFHEGSIYTLSVDCPSRERESSQFASFSLSVERPCVFSSLSLMSSETRHGQLGVWEIGVTKGLGGVTDAFAAD